ncbi:flavohemoglobin expression-modulating QEGLA motif protein [Membranihabitans maritimus]|uniref:flavohemoglobin expression-modulating QEGLA motif protein n=1 Tax=Membranihabitans maritimus TaxID=2904244 RepID=UPI001F45A076|nr:tyrosine/phenylalanine carboxypeptidase domain-containing protein [Membranihabitans maritimus]
MEWDEIDYKKFKSQLSEATIVEQILPNGGFLHIEEKLSFILIYRKKSNDEGTDKLVKAIGSYLLIGDDDLSKYSRLLKILIDFFTKKYNSYLLFEIYCGPVQSSTFIIKGPSHKLPATLQVLKEKLENIPNSSSNKSMDVVIEQTKKRHPKEQSPIINIQNAKVSGALLIALEVPPVYRDDNGKFYPIFFQSFRNHFVKAIQKALFEYLRVQTTSGIGSYYALGKSQIQEEVLKIDRQLTEIQNSYQFLIQVAPVNLDNIRKKFFQSNFKKLLKYHYRLLTADPDLLKRKLFNLKIEKIDDPALFYIFKEKREELDQQISMLGERGTKNFFYNSIRIYKGVNKELLTEATAILKNVPEESSKTQDVISANEFAKLAEDEFEEYRKQDSFFKSRIHLRKDLNILMVSRGELYVPSTLQVPSREAKALIQHEIGTHALTYHNGKEQPLTQLSIGLAEYETLQEGISVLSEYFSDGLTGNRLRMLAGRVIAGNELLKDANFHEVFFKLYAEFDFSKERAFNITARVFQGGGFLKDIIYLRGLLQAIKYLKEDGELTPLLAGKFAIKHLDVIRDLTKREILLKPKLTPRYMQMDSFQEKFTKIKEGIPLFKMISS